ncbi:unnamed protein product [Choristocarpus tenellus]
MLLVQGERRYYLGPVVDDLFLGTAQWVYDGVDNEGTEERMSGDDMFTFMIFQNTLNTKYGSDIITEFAFNGNGVLEQSVFSNESPLSSPSTGHLDSASGVTPQHDENWLTTAVPGMQNEYEAGGWANDDLLAAVLTEEVKTTFHWQSHTMSHLARDNLGQSDCTIEDTGNVELVKAVGFYYGNENYNWYSMTSPGITGLFNEFCLSSGAAALMTCYPGDNTYLPGVTSVSLVADNPFHPLTTTVSTNGYAGATIVPRFATFIYYNCVTAECLVQENEYIRRVVCGCTNLDPSASTGVRPS